MINSEKTFSKRQVAVMTAVIEEELTAAKAGWDRAPQLYALVKTSAIINHLPDLDAGTKERLEEALVDNPDHLTSVLQEELPVDNLEEVLPTLVFGKDVEGVALVMERVVIPQDAEENIPEDPAQRDQYLLNHPKREDMRIAAGVLRSGESWCTVRSRSHDDDKLVAQSADLVPDLISVLAYTLTDDSPDTLVD